MAIADDGSTIQCPTCGIDDDVFGLISTVRGVPLDEAIGLAIAEGAVDRHVFGNELATYVVERRPYDDLGAIVTKAQATLRGGTHHSVTELLQSIGILHAPGRSLDAISKFFGIVHPSELPGIEWMDARKFMGRRMALISPAYISRAAPSAIVVVNHRAEVDVFPVNETDTGHIVGLREVGIEGCHTAVITENPLHAVVANAVAKAALVSVPPVLSPWNGPARRLPVNNAKVVVWGIDYPWAFRWASAQVNGAIAAEPVTVSRNPAALPGKIADIIALAREPYEVIAEHLSRLPADEAVKVYRSLGIKEAEAHVIINRAPVASRKALADVLGGEVVATSVEVGGKTVVVSADSWYVDNVKISNFSLAVLEVWSEKDTVIARGEIRIGGKTIPFEEPIEAIRRNAMRWLERIVIASGGELPTIARSWASRIYEVATTLRRPETRAAGDLCRWEDGRLILPTFIINADGTTELNSAVDVAATASCAIAAPPDPFAVSAMNKINDEIALWTVLLHIAVAATRQIHAFNPAGVVITGPGRTAWQRALRDKLGLAQTTTAYPSGVLSRERRSVFPVLVEAISDATYREWVNKEGHNAILVTSRAGARLLRSRGWAVINATTEPSPAVIAMLPQVITLIRAALACGMPTAAGDTPYASIARAVAKSYPGLHGAGMGMAVLTLSAHARYDNTADANRLVAAARELCAIGDLVVDRAADGYTFDWDTYAAAMDSHGLPAGLQAAAIRALQVAKWGGAGVAGRIKVSPEAWKTVETLVLV